MKKEMRACGVCGKLHPVSELTEFDDTLLCGVCLQTDTIRCQRCGEQMTMPARVTEMLPTL